MLTSRDENAKKGKASIQHNDNSVVNHDDINKPHHTNSQRANQPATSSKPLNVRPKLALKNLQRDKNTSSASTPSSLSSTADSGELQALTSVSPRSPLDSPNRSNDSIRKKDSPTTLKINRIKKSSERSPRYPNLSGSCPSTPHTPHTQSITLPYRESGSPECSISSEKDSRSIESEKSFTSFFTRRKRSSDTGSSNSINDSGNSTKMGYSIDELLQNWGGQYDITLPVMKRLSRISKIISAQLSNQSSNQGDCLFFNFDNKDNLILTNNENKNSPDDVVIPSEKNSNDQTDTVQVIIDKNSKECFFIMNQHELGKGGLGKVVLCIHTTIKKDKINIAQLKPMAAKIFTQSLTQTKKDDIRDKIKRGLFAGLYNLPTQNNPVPILMMPFFNGPTLYDSFYIVDTKIDRESNGHFIAKRYADPETKIKTIIGVFNAVLRFHSHARMMHRDIKPENFILMKDKKIEIIDLDDSIDINAINKYAVNTYGYLPHEMQKGTYLSRTFIMTSLPSMDNIDKNFLKGMIKDNGNKNIAVLIQCGDLIYIYGCLNGTWELKQLKSELFTSMKFPNIGETTVHACNNRLDRRILQEIETGHDFNVNSPYLPQSDIWAAALVAADIISNELYEKEKLLKNDPNEKMITQEDMRQMIPDVFMESNLCIMAKLPAPDNAVRHLSIITPNGLFQLVNGKYDLILDQKTLRDLNLETMFTDNIDKKQCLNSIDLKYADQSFNKLRDFIKDKLNYSINKDSVYFMLSLPTETDTNKPKIVFTHDGLYYLNIDHQYELILKKSDAYAFTWIQKYLNQADDLINQKVYIKDTFTREFTTLNYAVVANKGHSLQHESLRSRFSRYEISNDWIHHPIEALFDNHVLPSLINILQDDLKKLRSSKTAMINEIVFQLYILPELIKIIRSCTQEAPNHRPDCDDFSLICFKLTELYKLYLTLSSRFNEDYIKIHGEQATHLLNDPFISHLNTKCHDYGDSSSENRPPNKTNTSDPFLSHLDSKCKEYEDAHPNSAPFFKPANKVTSHKTELRSCNTPPKESSMSFKNDNNP